MSDKRLRELLRQLQSGDLEVAPALYAERQRAFGEWKGSHRELALEIFVAGCNCATFGEGKPSCVNTGRGVEFHGGAFVPSRKVFYQYEHRAACLSWKAGYDDVYFHLRISGAGNRIDSLGDSINLDAAGYYWLWNPSNRVFNFAGEQPVHAWNPDDDAKTWWPAVKSAAEEWITKNLLRLQEMQDAHVHAQAVRQWENLEDLQAKMQEAKVSLAEVLLAEPEHR